MENKSYYNGNNALWPVLADIRKDIGDARVDSVKNAMEAKLESCKTESGIQGAIQVQDTANQVNFRALDNKICETEKSAIIFAKDAIIEALKMESRLTERITAFERNVDTNFCETKKDISDVNFNLEKVNTHLTHAIDKNSSDVQLQIEKKFAHLREEELEDKLSMLTREHEFIKNNLLFSNQFSSLQNSVNSILQHQQLTNKVVQFGAGNVATPTNTQALNNV